MNNAIISCVKSATDVETRDVTVENVIEAMRTGGKHLRGRVEEIRAVLNNGHDPKEAKGLAGALKKKLPGILWSGQFSQRANDKIVQHSGLICIDLDNLGDRLQGIRAALITSPYVYAVFLSPSGTGLKVVLRIPADASRHLASFRAAKQHIEELNGAKVDEACKDLARLCFGSYDPHLYYNPEAQELTPLPEPEKPKPSSNGECPPDLSLRERIAYELLWPLEYSSEKGGYFCKCPGAHLHTSVNGKKDCIVYLDGLNANLVCQHNSCTKAVLDSQELLRSRISKAEYAAKRELTETAARNGELAAEQAIELLAKLPLLEYDRKRKAEAERLGCRESTLDKLVDAKRPKPVTDDKELPGVEVMCPDVDPWPEPVNGAEVLNDISASIASNVALPDGAADAATLWAAHTYVYDDFTCSPRLNISSPEKGCGKTVLRDVVSCFVNRSFRTASLTEAVAFRMIHHVRPTVLADEYDRWLPKNEELIGILNSGHRKGDAVPRCQGDGHDVRAFYPFGPVALCGLRHLPETLHDRSIVIKLHRAKPGEYRPNFDCDKADKEKELGRKLARWVSDNRTRITLYNPHLPDGSYNRLADNWRPLFAIAEVAGGDWPKRCAEAFAKLNRPDDETETYRVQLLWDIRQVFAERSVDRVFSRDLIEALAALTERPWGEVNRGKPINERWLARKLADFGIHSKTLRIAEEQAKGYELADFSEVFERYLKG